MKEDGFNFHEFQVLQDQLVAIRAIPLQDDLQPIIFIVPKLSFGFLFGSHSDHKKTEKELSSSTV